MAYLYLLMVFWVVLQVFGLLIHQRRGDRAAGSGDVCLSPVIIACLCSFVGIDGVLKNQLDKYVTGCNTQR
jgi:hypothetical protein